MIQNQLDFFTRVKEMSETYQVIYKLSYKLVPHNILLKRYELFTLFYISASDFLNHASVSRILLLSQPSGLSFTL